MNKLTILALHLGYGGVEKSIASLCNILVQQYDIEIISVYKLYEQPAFHIDERVKITYLLDTNLSPNRDDLKAAIKAKNPIEIIKQASKSAKILKLKKSKMVDAIKGIKSGIVISTRIEHNKLLSSYGSEKLIKIVQEHTYHNDNMNYIEDLVKSCENVDYFIPVSQLLTDFYSTYFDKTKVKCMFIPHSLDFIPEEKSELDDKSIISIGRLSPEKGFDDLIDVFKIVHEKHKDWKLNIIGDGKEKDNIQRKIKEYSLEESIILHGYKDKAYINEKLKKSSIYAMPSHEESFGLVLIEAQSFGVPCVAFDSAKGACEIIVDDVNGYLIKNRSNQDMANKIIKLIEDKELRKSMGQDSRENSYKYSKDSVGRQWFDFFNSINMK